MVPSEKKASVFLTSQTPVTYKLVTNLSDQQTPPKDVNQLNIKEILEFMIEQFHPKCFIVRECYKFWSHMDRKPGETIQELVKHLSGRSNLQFSINSRSIGQGFVN